jgi:hypothetical protein
MEDIETDLNGFQLNKLNVQQQAIRLQCDGTSRRAEANWVSVAQQQQLPPEAKLKGLIRMVSFMQLRLSVPETNEQTLVFWHRVFPQH